MSIHQEDPSLLESPPHTMAAIHIRRILMLGLLFLVLLLLDQGTKLWAVEHMRNAQPEIYARIFTLTYAENTGGWGSLGANWTPLARKVMLVIAPTLVLAFLGYYLMKNEEFDWAKGVGYVCIVAGGAGNLIDRFRLDHVIDFLYIGYGRIGTNIFNVADMAILAGFFLVLIRSWGQPEGAPPPSESEPVPESLDGGVESVGSEAESVDTHLGE